MKSTDENDKPFVSTEGSMTWLVDPSDKTGWIAGSCVYDKRM